MSAQVKKKKKEKPKPDYSRGSFVPVKAPCDQACACGCGNYIRRGSDCFARPYVERGRQRGFTRIINMDHYDDWFELVAHEYAKTIMDRKPETKTYFRR